MSGSCSSHTSQPLYLLLSRPNRSGSLYCSSGWLHKHISFADGLARVLLVQLLRGSKATGTFPASELKVELLVWLGCGDALKVMPGRPVRRPWCCFCVFSCYAEPLAGHPFRRSDWLGSWWYAESAGPQITYPDPVAVAFQHASRQQGLTVTNQVVQVMHINGSLLLA